MVARDLFSCNCVFFMPMERGDGLMGVNAASTKTRRMNGRRVIVCNESAVTRENVLDILSEALSSHVVNMGEIDYLWKYYCGNQPVLYRDKKIRPEICNKIVENRANEIVSFKVGYLCGEPIQYVSRSSEESVVSQINELNEMMFSEDKDAKDQELVEWQMICGTAFRLVLPDKSLEVENAPFEIYTLDPRDTFVVYSSDIGNKPLIGVKCGKDKDGNVQYSVYTDKLYFLIKNGEIVSAEAHSLGVIPIFEYPANNARLGAFEIVLPLLDAINSVVSNRLDGIEQFIQAFIKFVNCDISKEDYLDFLELGAIKVKSGDGQKADVDIVTTELNQEQTQTLKEDLYNAVLTICGMPNRNGGSSTSDTGTAVLLRDGWSLAEARAKDSEHMFKKSEKKMLKLILRICKDYADFSLQLKDIAMKFTRRNYEAIQSKSQVLVSMLQQPKIHPRLAFLHSGLFTDAESAYAMSKEYYEGLEQETIDCEGTHNNANVRQDNKTERESSK